MLCGARKGAAQWFVSFKERDSAVSLGLQPSGRQAYMCLTATVVSFKLAPPKFFDAMRIDYWVLTIGDLYRVPRSKFYGTFSNRSLIYANASSLLDNDTVRSSLFFISYSTELYY